LAADADPRNPSDKSLGDGIRCDEAGCIGRLKDGSMVAIARTPAAFEEDCLRAAIVITARDAPEGCRSMIIDRGVLQRLGALTLRKVGDRFELTPTRPPGYDRPWAPAAGAWMGLAEPGQPGRPPTRDATPRFEDLEPGD
jgi:competence protein ComEC